MIVLNGKVVDEIGWAYTLLWVCTKDGYSIHLYNNRIKFKGKYIRVGRLFGRLHGSTIGGFLADGNWFSVYGDEGWSFSVHRCGCDTARIFKRGKGERHWVYQNGNFA